MPDVMLNVANLEGGAHHARLYLLRPGNDADLRVDPDADSDMNTRRNAAPSQSTAPPKVQHAPTTPSTPATPGAGLAHPELQFLTGLMAVQKHLGEISASLQALVKTVDSTKSKVDELTAWKNKILGGAVVLGVVSTFVVALLGLSFKMFYDILMKQENQPVAAIHLTPPARLRGAPSVLPEVRPGAPADTTPSSSPAASLPR